MANVDGALTDAARKFVLITGCSGGGKSTLLTELRSRGYATIPEPGRRIVAEERATGGTALPWIDLSSFAKRAVAMARADLAAAANLPGPVFFDRGLIDAAVALEFTGGPSCRETLGTCSPYGRTVLFAPPWREIFHGDADRKQSFQAACEEAERLEDALSAHGHQIVLLPKATVLGRAEFVEGLLRRERS